MKSRGWRSRCVKWGGVNITTPNKTFIGENVTFDTNQPELITIEEGVTITLGCVLLTHFLVSDTRHYTWGKIVVKKGAYIGARTIICKSVTIGEGAIIGAGSIVTKDIPPYEVWAGVPAKFIRKRNIG